MGIEHAPSGHYGLYFVVKEQYRENGEIVAVDTIHVKKITICLPYHLFNVLTAQMFLGEIIDLGIVVPTVPRIGNHIGINLVRTVIRISGNDIKIKMLPQVGDQVGIGADGAPGTSAGQKPIDGDKDFFFHLVVMR